MSTFILPAVEIGWIDTFRVAALLPEIPAVAMPIAAGEAPLMGRKEEEEGFIFGKMGEGRDMCSGFRVGFFAKRKSESAGQKGW